MEDINLIECVGNMLLRTRLDSKLTLREVQKRTGINKSTICKIETGKQDPRVTTVLKLFLCYREEINKNG